MNEVRSAVQACFLGALVTGVYGVTITHYGVAEPGFATGVGLGVGLGALILVAALSNDLDGQVVHEESAECYAGDTDD